MTRWTTTFVLLATCAVPRAPEPAQDRDRSVAVTFDDLVVGGRDPGLARVQALTDGLLRTLADEGVPATAFVNEAKLEGPDRPARIAVLRRWVDAGHVLGNHTYSHPSLQDTPLADYEADVIRGEAVIRGLEAEKGRALKWFRHPYLRTGPTLAVRDEFERFLAARGYTVAPVTVNSSDWLFNWVYTEAHTRGDAATMRRVGEAYVGHVAEAFAFHERAAEALLGRPIAHVLLVHANELNADWFDEVAAQLRGRGYRFVPLAEALADTAYAEPDRFAGAAGVSWLQRWDVTRGRRQVDWTAEPAVPADVQAAFAASPP
jgi:peptidoglycan/xylan/chitin deacetylase (PgdA/CDA1 family)